MKRKISTNAPHIAETSMGFLASCALSDSSLGSGVFDTIPVLAWPERAFLIFSTPLHGVRAPLRPAPFEIEEIDGWVYVGISAERRDHVRIAYHITGQQYPRICWFTSSSTCHISLSHHLLYHEHTG
jgi:hypothetical protein